MSSLPRMLLRYCQSVIVALALCLIPEVEASFAQSARDIALDLDTWVAQEVVVPSSTSEVNLGDSPSPESMQTPDFSEFTGSSEALPSPAVAPDNFFNQPTIGSQLLLPPGDEAVQLLLAPASEASPAALETQLTSPATQNGDRQTSLAPISSQRFLPAATLPVGLLPPAQEAPANPLAIAIDNEVRSVNRQSIPIDSPSIQEQVGRTLSLTNQHRSQPAPADPSGASTPRSTPALLPASTVPRSPVSRSSYLGTLPRSSQRSSERIALSSDPSVTAPIENTLVKTVAPSNLALTAQNAKTLQGKLSSKLIPNPSAAAPIEAQIETEETPESSSIASRELGVAIAPPETSSVWRSWQNQILIGLGTLALMLIALIRWGLSRGQAPLVEETDWDNLPRSRSGTIAPPPDPAPVRIKRVSEEFLQALETGGLPPLMLQPPVILTTPKSTPSPEKSPHTLATSTLLDRKPRQRDPFVLWDNEDQDPEPKPVKQQHSSGLHSLDLGIWLPIVLIGLMGLAAWLFQSHFLNELLIFYRK